MTQARDLEGSKADLRDSGIVPARQPSERIETLPPALILDTPRPSVRGFGAALAGAGDLLLAAGRLADARPFAALYRRGDDYVRRERVMHGAAGHGGPMLATDGRRVLVGQPADAAGGGVGLAALYRCVDRELELERCFEPHPQDSLPARFGERAVLGQDLLVLGHSASLCAYRHSPIGWLSCGLLEPPRPYEWNPSLGQGLAVLRSRIVVGNPRELEGHRSGPGRAFVYRSKGELLVLEGVLSGDGIECGREERAGDGFGACIHVSDDLVAISAPHELASDGSQRSRVYVYRAQTGALTLLTRLDVPSCHGGICLVGDRLICLGDALHVFTRRNHEFVPLANYDSQGASTLAACGPVIALGEPEGAGKVALYFAAQL